MTASASLSILPPLSADEAEHSARLAAFLREHIAAAGGWIDFETFMDLALYAPGLGYYSAGSAKLGRAGDFVTAPEVSDLFSHCVARQCAEILAATGGGEILEFGAGSGRMAAAVLTHLAALGIEPHRYAILEVSAELRERQRERLAALPRALAERVCWLERWPAQRLSGVVLANEVLDALPCRRFALHAEGVRAIGVQTAADGTFTTAERQADAALEATCRELAEQLPHSLPAGYRSELCLRLQPWIGGAAACLERAVMLLFDYGLPRAQYYHPQRRDGTLRCHYKHRAHDDPLIHVGVQDITAWVDFTRVAEAAHAAHLDVLGFATQAAFLLGTGIEADIGSATTAPERARLAGEARRLLLPGEMGEAFKVMALGRGFEAPLAGFAHQDLRGSL
jgi:SAM-dependent MidA family methyltransferase